MRALALSLAMLTLAHAVPAATTSYEDILGRWCGDRSNKYLTILDFMRDSFSVTWRDTNRSRVFRIIRYEFRPRTVKVRWVNLDEKETWTEYGDFMGDAMLQLPHQGAPTYVFRRC
jgi:hypothetical protein